MWDCYLCNANDSHKPTATLKLDFITASVHHYIWYQPWCWYQMVQQIKSINLSKKNNNKSICYLLRMESVNMQYVNILFMPYDVTPTSQEM